MPGDPRYSKKNLKRWKSRVLVMSRRRIGKGNLSKAHIARKIFELCPDAPPELAGYLLMEWFVSRSRTADRPKSQPKRHVEQRDDFLLSYEWRRLRMAVIKERGARCECCGATPAQGIVINVDHIQPRKTHPKLALEKSNLQVLCHVCNHGKGNWDTTDWREAPQPAVAKPLPPLTRWYVDSVKNGLFDEKPRLVRKH